MPFDKTTYFERYAEVFVELNGKYQLTCAGSS